MGWFRLHFGRVGTVHLPAVGVRGLGPQAVDDLEAVDEAVDLLARGWHGQSERVQLVVGGAGAEPEDEPPRRDPVEGLGHLGDERG